MGHQPWRLALRRTLWSKMLLAGVLALTLPVEGAQPVAPADWMAQAAPSAPPASPNPPAPSGLEVWLEDNKTLATGMATAAALALAYGVVLRVKPRWLLFLPGKFKIPNTSWEVPLGLLLWLKYQPRVLDAWVASHLVETQRRFAKLQTVHDRRIHIPIQIKLDDDPIDQLAPSHLTPLFSLDNSRRVNRSQKKEPETL